jgi:hypothetical protein
MSRPSDKPVPLVIVVPGIGGSVLESQSGRVLWGTGDGNGEALLRNPRRLDVDHPVRPVGLVSGRMLLPGFARIHGYRELLDRMGTIVGGPVDHGAPGSRRADARVVGFPYDFRRSMAESADELGHLIKTRLDLLGLSGRYDQLIIVAHSTGGLVVRHWLARQTSPVQAVMTLGTPHLGSVKALHHLVNGADWWTGALPELRDELRRWPSMYELLPQCPSIEDGRSSELLHPADLPLDWLRPGARRAHAVHEETQRSMHKGLVTIGYRAFLGYGHSTLLYATWDGATLRAHKDPVPWLGKGWGSKGDGTVPAYSALPIDGESFVRRDYLPAGHTCLVVEREPLSAFAHLIRLAHCAEERHRAEEQHRAGRVPMIGLDLDDAYLAGEPVALRAELDPLGSRPAGMTLAYEVTGDTTYRRGSLAYGDGVWSAALTGLPPGRYDLTVRAEPADVYPELRTSDWFDVVGEVLDTSARYPER